ncbi:hypothetical protein DFJ77DRAFT_470967 [Powellomyces hirtus]|nr:hypothetical protein DFJ77DRAFT_470967 [Powellomyces hirtus]
MRSTQTVDRLAYIDVQHRFHRGLAPFVRSWPATLRMRFIRLSITALAAASAVFAQKANLNSDSDNVLAQGQSIVSQSDATVAFTWRTSGAIALTVNGKSYEKTITVPNGDAPNTVLKLNPIGFLVATNEAEDVLWKSDSKTQGSSRPYELIVENDRKARVRDADAVIVWEYPPVRDQIPFLQSNRMGYLRHSEAIVSDNGRYMFYLDEFGSLTANDGNVFNKVAATGERDPRMLLLRDSGLLELVDLDNRVRWSSGVKGLASKGPYVLTIDNAGVATIVDGFPQVIWSYQFTNTPRPTQPPVVTQPTPVVTPTPPVVTPKPPVVTPTTPVVTQPTPTHVEHPPTFHHWGAVNCHETGRNLWTSSLWGFDNAELKEAPSKLPLPWKPWEGTPIKFDWTVPNRDVGDMKIVGTVNLKSDAINGPAKAKVGDLDLTITYAKGTLYHRCDMINNIQTVPMKEGWSCRVLYTTENCKWFH